MGRLAGASLVATQKAYVIFQKFFFPCIDAPNGYTLFYLQMDANCKSIKVRTFLERLRDILKKNCGAISFAQIGKL